MPWEQGVGKVALVCGAGGFIGHHLVGGSSGKDFGFGALISSFHVLARRRRMTF